MNRTPEEWKDVVALLALLETGHYWPEAIEDIGTLAGQLAEARELLEDVFKTYDYDWNVEEHIRDFLSRTEAKA